MEPCKYVHICRLTHISLYTYMTVHQNEGAYAAGLGYECSYTDGGLDYSECVVRCRAPLVCRGCGKAHFAGFDSVEENSSLEQGGPLSDLQQDHH